MAERAVICVSVFLLLVLALQEFGVGFCVSRRARVWSGLPSRGCRFRLLMERRG